MNFSNNLSIHEILSLPCMPLYMRFQLPEIAAIYFVVKPPNLILYVGQSKNLSRRFQGHNYLKRFQKHDDEYQSSDLRTKVFYLDCSHLQEEKRLYYEGYYIAKLRPLYNKTGTFKHDVQNYTNSLLRIILNLNNIDSQQEIIRYVNAYSHELPTKNNPSAGLNLLHQILLTEYKIFKKENIINYRFNFKVAHSFDSDTFKEVFVNTIKYSLLPKKLLEKENVSENIELIFELVNDNEIL